jgi:23S rRNA pseudouridine1911/1915/1917 synthase
VQETAGAKSAVLFYKKLGEFQNRCLIEIELKTGRKHQIRIQLAATQKPIIGDRKYGSDQPFKKGIALHSYQLTIEHPTLKQPNTFTQDPPHWWNVDKFMGR